MPIVVEKLSHTYTAGSMLTHTAVSGVDITIMEGEFLGIIGHTGSGKSTLVQHLNGLLLPSEGRVVVDGLDLANKKTRMQARALIGMVFQYPEYQLFADSVYDDIAYGPKNLKLEPDEIDARVVDAMRRVGLDFDTFAQKSPFEISGGEKRRAALAGVIAMRPKYFVLDEPMAGLDPKGRKEILSMLEELREQTGCTIIMVSHSMDDVCRHATRILALDHGKVAYIDTPANVFSHSAALEEMGLSLPQASLLAMELRKRGCDVPSDICTTRDMLAFLEARLAHE